MSQAFNPGDRVCLVAKWTEKNGNLVQDCGTVVDVRISETDGARQHEYCVREDSGVETWLSEERIEPPEASSVHANDDVADPAKCRSSGAEDVARAHAVRPPDAALRRK
jgi:hypothetical protein